MCLDFQVSSFEYLTAISTRTYFLLLHCLFDVMKPSGQRTGFIYLYSDIHVMFYVTMRLHLVALILLLKLCFGISLHAINVQDIFKRITNRHLTSQKLIYLYLSSFFIP